MRIAILTLSGPEHRFVAGALTDAYPEEVVAIIVAEPPRRSTLARLRSYWRRYTLTQLGSRVAAKCYERLTGHAASRRRRFLAQLYPNGDSGVMPRADLVRRVAGYNDASCLTLLDELAPDIIAVYGTSIIREGVVRRAKRAIVNLHTGISPRYRGSDSVFWALHNREPEWIGVTLHVLDAGVDAGPILGTARPNVEAGDDEGTLFAKCVQVGAKLYVEVVRSLMAGSATPQIQQLDGGREYRFVDRTVAAERRVDRLLRDGLLAHVTTQSTK